MKEWLERVEQRNRRNQKLLSVIKEHLPQLEQRLFVMNSDYEDKIYRFYSQSAKVYGLQDSTLEAVEIFRRIGQKAETELCEDFEEIIAGGTQKKLENARP